MKTFELGYDDRSLRVQRHGHEPLEVEWAQVAEARMRRFADALSLRRVDGCELVVPSDLPGYSDVLQKLVDCAPSRALERLSPMLSLRGIHRTERDATNWIVPSEAIARSPHLGSAALLRGLRWSVVRASIFLLGWGMLATGALWLFDVRGADRQQPAWIAAVSLAPLALTALFRRRFVEETPQSGSISSEGIRDSRGKFSSWSRIERCWWQPGHGSDVPSTFWVADRNRLPRAILVPSAWTPEELLSHARVSPVLHALPSTTSPLQLAPTGIVYGLLLLSFPLALLESYFAFGLGLHRFWGWRLTLLALVTGPGALLWLPILRRGLLESRATRKLVAAGLNLIHYYLFHSLLGARMIQVVAG